MKNNQLLPFERNRYYAGKMLTSADFEAEQTYLNNKRRFINQTMYGAGIVCGCSVISLDDLSVLIESGVVLDDYGREIVVGAAKVKKLSATKGFESLKTTEAMLCLRYKEQEVHEVYCINYPESGKEYEANRIREDYELFLMDYGDAANPRFIEEDEFLLHNILCHDENCEIELKLPAVICKGQYCKLELTARKKTTKPVTFQGMLQMPGFQTLAGEHQLKLELDHGELKKEYWILADTNQEETELVWDTSSTIKVKIENVTAEELVLREIAKNSLEMRNLGTKKDYISLAKLKLTKTDSAYLIEEIQEQGIKSFVAAPAQYQLRQEYRSYFAEEKQAIRQDENRHGFVEDRTPKRKKVTATGILEIPLGEKVKRGDIKYSAEIIHGLGKGNVYVELGTERLREHPASGANTISTFFGNPNLFPKEQAGNGGIETAVQVLNDKGSFIAAAKVSKDVETLFLSYRWVAVKFEAETEGLTEKETGRISAVTPTVVLSPKENHFFEVKFTQMEKCSVSYELTEEGSGEITVDGVYTAPGKEGVYEIRIYCTELPILCTYAYAIVKRKEG